jgi:signal transduction histidine kinase
VSVQEPKTTEIDAPRLRIFLDEHRDEILAAWHQDVRAMPPLPARDGPPWAEHLPQLLDRIAQLTDELLAAGGPPRPPSERPGEGSELGQLLRAYGALRDAIMRLWGERILERQHLLDLRILNGAIEEAIVASLDRHAGARERVVQDLEQAVHSRDEVLAIVSHDLRNPLAAISIAASNLVDESCATSRTRKQAELIQRSATKMEQLIYDLLDMASIQARRLKLDLLSEDPGRIIEAVVEAHETMAAEQGVDIIADCDLHRTLRCDRARVEQVLANLLGNAIQYGRAGDVVFVRCEERNRQACFSVADNGPGIAPSEMENLFDPYYSARRHAAKPGIGLGLYIARGIVQAHGGTIWVRSKPGEGATFFFTLPLPAAP